MTESPVEEPATPAILVDDLAVDRGGVRVLERLNLELRRGEVLAVQGASGSGKTTLLAALCGLAKPSSGTIVVLGSDLGAASDGVRSARRLHDFGLVFQGDELLSELTLGENITLPLRLLRGRLSRSGQRHADELAGILGIRSLIERLPAEVSGGQLQRTAIARALVHQPEIVLADEPTASLDGAAASRAMGSLIAISRDHRAAVVIVTHDDDVAARCDRVLVLEDGRLRHP